MSERRPNADDGGQHLADEEREEPVDRVAAPTRCDQWAPDDRSAVWPLAVVFGLVSVPWTYGFVVGLEIPLWPSFVASAAYFAAGSGRRALLRALASTQAGIVYGAGTLAVVAALDGGPLALSLVVGVAMLLASLHGAVPLVSFAPGGFLGYASLFSVDAAGATVFGIGGLAGATLATAVAIAIGTVIGFGADRARATVAGTTATASH